MVPNCSFKFEGPFAHLPLNAVRNKGGGISEGQAREGARIEYESSV